MRTFFSLKYFIDQLIGLFEWWQDSWLTQLIYSDEIVNLYPMGPWKTLFSDLLGAAANF